MERGSGLLVHITSLPSRHGIGTFGKEARKFVRFLAEAGQKYWQLLPLNPTSYGDSPYQSFSAFALNPYFIDLDYLVRDGYLTKDEVRPIRGGRNPSYCDYGKIYSERFDILHTAFLRAYPQVQEAVDRFYRRNRRWVEDYALFMTIKQMHGGTSWQEWPRKYRMHTRKALREVRAEQEETYRFWLWMQYEAHEQYRKLKRYAKRKGVRIIGDMPIYVALDSADVWGNPRLFQLDRNRRPTKVAGVPPDFFSETGQLWGNPLYDWDACAKTRYRWWRMRIRAMSKLYDLLRIDHFRGFDSYWAVPASETTAINGEWIEGPGYDLFAACDRELRHVQIIAEDLGIITDSVRALKERCGFPGMKVMQFAFDDYEQHLAGNYGADAQRYSQRIHCRYSDPESEKLGHLCNPFLPHNFETNCVAYIGTHDNDIQENFIAEHPQLIGPMMDYLRISDPADINDTLIGSLMRSSADVVVFLPQDILHLGKNSRINTPGTTNANWQFRFRRGQFDHALAEHLKRMTEEANR